MTNISSQVFFISPSLLLLLSCFPLSFYYSSEYFCPSVHIVQLHCRTSLSDDWGCCILCVELERVFGPLCVRVDLEHERERETEAVFFVLDYDQCSHHQYASANVKLCRRLSI